nr:MAG TPA: hypothetical protein [Caudoviricetes sp.]
MQGQAVLFKKRMIVLLNQSIRLSNMSKGLNLKMLYISVGSR